MADERPPLRVRVIGRMVALALAALASTWRVRRGAWPVQGPSVIALWHGVLVPVIALHRQPRWTGGAPVHGLTSLSSDGDVVAVALRRLGYQVLRGSTSRGGLSALRAAARVLRGGGAPALAVDGPRGPAGQVQPGAEALSRLARAPVVCIRVRAAGWRARSWDAALVPWPFARVELDYALWEPGQGELSDALGPLNAAAPGATAPRPPPAPAQPLP